MARKPFDKCIFNRPGLTILLSRHRFSHFNIHVNRDTQAPLWMQAGKKITLLRTDTSKFFPVRYSRDSAVIDCIPNRNKDFATHFWTACQFQNLAIEPFGNSFGPVGIEKRFRLIPEPYAWCLFDFFNISSVPGCLLLEVLCWCMCWETGFEGINLRHLPSKRFCSVWIQLDRSNCDFTRLPAGNKISFRWQV